VTQVLSQRALNRATLARQYLLERAAVPTIDAIEHLGGMQSQAPLAPYVGLWTRLLHFDAGELSELTEQRQVVRAALMRNTVHLVSARDCLDWSAHFSGLRAAQFRARFGRGLDGVSRPALVERARLLLDEKPRTRVELRDLLTGLLPDAEPDVLVHAVAHHIALCQVPPRGVWGRNGPVALVPVEAYLGARLRTTPMEDLVVRYLAAFGPASVADIQLWSGLTHLRELVERMPLREFQGENGQVLVDLPDAPRPHEDIPAPPRFLPEYDNLLLSHNCLLYTNPSPRDS
jgi:hypothetical protein